MSTLSTFQSNFLVDCFGKKYTVVKMPGNGFCLYHSLSYCLTGHSSGFGYVINDCLNVFENIPEIFRLRTNFGSRQNSSLTLSNYVAFMQHAIRQMQTGFTVDTDAWGEDAHIVAIALLYDIVVFTYSPLNAQWYVVNETGSRGYICLLNSTDHFDVLAGVDNCAPEIPTAVHTQCVNRRDYNAAGDAWLSLQRSYCFQFVYHFPQQYSGVVILNNPVAVPSVHNTQVNDPIDSSTTEACETGYKCGSCDKIFAKLISLNMHKMKMHGKRENSRQTDCIVETESVDNLQVCDSCGVKFAQPKALKLHRLQKHKSNLHDLTGCEFTSQNPNVVQMHKNLCDAEESVCIVDTESLNSAQADMDTDFERTRDINDEDSYISVAILSGNDTELNDPIDSRTTDARESDYKCDSCEKTFAKLCSLNMHKRRMHGKRKTLNQTEPTVETQSVNNLQVFDICGEFTHAEVLKLHKLKKHDSNLSGYPGCEFTSDNAKGAKMHRKRCHSEVESACEVDCESLNSLQADSMDIDLQGTDAISDAKSDISLTTNLSTCSRRSLRIANKHSTTQHVLRYPPTKQGRFVCDAVDCTSEFGTAKGLAIHKGRSHKVVKQPNITTVESDNESVNTVASTGSSVRRSARLQNRERACGVENSTVDSMQSEKLNMQPGVVHSSNNDDLTHVDKNCSGDNFAQFRRTSSTKQHAKMSFNECISEHEKKICPKNRKHHQIDHLYDKLKSYHDKMLNTVSNTTTERISQEIIDVVKNTALINNSEREIIFSDDDKARLNKLNETCKLLQPRSDWTWGAGDDTEQGRYNDERMQLCVSKECEWKIIECDNCGSTGILVGDQLDMKVCYDCTQLKRVNVKECQKKEEAWAKVRPVNKHFPKTADGQDLPKIYPGDMAVITPVHPVVTIKKNHYHDKRLRLECISLVQDPVPTWSKVLPRTSLADRFMVIERRVRDCAKYIVANADRVRQWLRYLFLNHTEFIRLRRQNELTIDESEIERLGPNLELAEVDSDLAEHSASEAKEIEQEIEQNDEGITDATTESGLSETHVFSFDRYPELYLKSKHVLRIRKEGKIEIVKDDTVRKPSYSTSANICFPHLYPHCEASPLDFNDNKLSRYLLKKQATFAHRMSDGKLNFIYAEDDVHMGWQYSRLSEQTVRATIGYYLSSHPSVAHVPLANITTAFRDGVDEHSGLLDSHLPDLSLVMQQIPNSRQKWFSERLSIETVSRNVGAPNAFVTINLDPRASPDVRRLIYYLDNGRHMERGEPFIKNTAEFTRLLDKYAPFVAVYLYRKVKIMMRVFFTKICGIPEKEANDWTQQDVTETGWYWGRVEFTETRGIAHWHFLCKLPHTLLTELLGRMIHNGRVVRNELKRGNIIESKREQAWEMIEMGLLASRYVALFAHSISTASFYSEDVGIDGHDDSKVVHLEPYRDEFVKNYRQGNINLKTHPIMRRFDDPECNSNVNHEMANVAAISCVHKCIRTSCGGNPADGEGCRFDFPKKNLKHTVCAIMQVNADQNEARVLLRRTAGRVSNTNRYLLRYLRSNHDVSVLIDSAHKLRYSTKYASKSANHAHLLDEMIEHLNKRATGLLPPNMKQVLTHLILADCSHRAFISKQELAYRVMNLPDVMKSFANVDVVGFYKRSNLQVAYDDQNTIELSDRTEYMAYCERNRDDTELSNALSKDVLKDMPFSEFAETVQHKWINSKKSDGEVIDEATKRKFRTRDVNSGHWRFTVCRRRKHVRPSTVLYTAPAIDYELVEPGKTTTQTTFFDLSIHKRHQLYRAYYELVMYVPWENSPDETFLDADVRAVLEDRDQHYELDARHSLQRLEEFFKVYKRLYDAGEVAEPGSRWHADNRFSYSMYLVSQHNRHVHLDRVDNKGVLKAQFDEADELENVDVDIRTAVSDVSDLSDYPTFETFMPVQQFRDIVEQKPLQLSEICVAFPLQHQWQKLEELVTHDRKKRFIAKPPSSQVDYHDMTPIQQFAVDLGIDEKHQILFVCGKAGSGKTEVARKICEHFAGRVQATAYTGKAASLFNGPTIHSMFGWSHNEHKSVLTVTKPDDKKVQQFRVTHEDIDLFVVEEALAIAPASLALMDEVMTAAFNPKRKTDSNDTVLPFGGKKMLFLGDQAQLSPVGSVAVYDDGRPVSESTTKRETKQSKRTKTGQLIFEKYLVPNCIYLQRGQRNSGLLGEICDKIRHGQLTEDDCVKLTYQNTRFPDVCTDYGIHYQNEQCQMFNWRQLWNECRSLSPPCRMYLCKASYYVTADNDQIIESLSTLPPQAYEYAPDILCVAEGCEVRLLYNLNISAGLVTSATGTVMKVIYDNADVHLLTAGKHSAPYCIIVAFEGFQGLVVEENGVEKRIYPFPNQRTWVPIFRKRFNVNIKHLPAWVRKKQLEKLCYRTQFGLDLSSNITAHRAQGQTMSNCLVSVDLGLEHPDMKLPPELSAVFYVACTRVTKLENLFVSPIHSSVLKKLGQTDDDKHRRSVDEKLKNAAKDLACKHGKYSEMLAELAWKADISQNAQEWTMLQQQTEAPKPKRRLERFAEKMTSLGDFLVDLGDVQFSMFTTPVMSERHIGIDQGTQNFAIAVVERVLGENPMITDVKHYTDLGLKVRCKAADVLIALKDKTDLLLWVNPTSGRSVVDRVIVHLEQMDKRNRNSKQMSIELGKLLQQQTDPEVCVVKLSQPHILRATGPAFQLGDEVVEALDIQPALFQRSRSKADSNPSVTRQQQNVDQMSDVEPDDDDDGMTQSRSGEYETKKRKKQMSSALFRYIVEANDEQLQQMKLTVHESVQTYWRQKIASDSAVKLDDVGDALLHALDELLCGSSNYRQLVPAAPTVHINRTIVVAVFTETTYWVALNCRWNAFVFENFGWFGSGLRDCYFRDQSVVDKIKKKCFQTDVGRAMSEFEGNGNYDPVDHIKVIVKQLTGHTELGLTNQQAGCLTDSTTKAMKGICDSVMGVQSKLYERKDKILGSVYSRTSTVYRDRKFQVINSTGKHTNAVLSCLSWMQQNMKDFVEKRREIMSEQEKRLFFDAIFKLTQSTSSSMEMLHLSDNVKTKLRSGSVSSVRHTDNNFERNIADLVLIGMSKNAQHVKAISANSRKFSRAAESLETVEQADNTMDMQIDE